MATTPSLESLISLLQRCRQTRDLAYARQLYAYMRENQLESHRILGNYLVPALVDCGCLRDAQHVFDRLPFRNEHSWCSLILGYIDFGEPHRALLARTQMLKDHTFPNSHTYVALLKACARSLDTDAGAQLHSDITKGGLDQDLFIANSLMDMYSKCGSLAEMQCVFDTLPSRDVVSWNALMAGYAKHGVSDELQRCFDQMQLEGNAPDDVTFLCTLKACSVSGALELGQELHSELNKRGLEGELFVSTTLVDLYAKCGLLAEAREVFDRLPVRGAISWNPLIAGYVDRGCGEEALNCVKQMEAEGVPPVLVTFLCSLKASGTMGALKTGHNLHSQLVKRGLEGELYVGSALVDMYAKCGLLSEAQAVLNKLPARCAVSWTALIVGYTDYGCGNEVLDCSKQMQQEGISPVVATYVCNLKACSLVGSLQTGQEVHADIVGKGLEKDLEMRNALVDMYAKCGLFLEALDLFGQLASWDTFPWTSLITGYADHGFSYEALDCLKQMQQEGFSLQPDTLVSTLKASATIRDLGTGSGIHAKIVLRGYERELYVGHTLLDFYIKCGALAEARRVFDQLPVQGVVAWSALIAGYAEHEFGEEALNLFKQMEVEGVSPVAVTFACSLKACGIVGALDIGEKIHTELTLTGWERDIFVGSTLVDMYAKCGLLAEAQEVFEVLATRDVVSWNAMIKAYGENHEGAKAVQCFLNMQEQGVKPDSITFTCLLAACSHSSLMIEGQEYFRLMTKEHEIRPAEDHLTSMVDLFARSGYVCQAEKFAEVTQCLQSKGILRALLSACKTFGEVEVGLRCFHQLVQINQEGAASYLLMADIYASAGRWSEAIGIEETRRDVKAKKRPAAVSIEVDKNVYRFVVGGSHSRNISLMLENLSLGIKNRGYVPSLDLVITQSLNGALLEF